MSSVSRGVFLANPVVFNAPLLSLKQWHGVVHMQAKEDGEVAGFGPILAGQALREAWAKQNSSPADHARQEALESPSRLQVVVLDDSTAPSGSMSTLVDQHTGGLLLHLCNLLAFILSAPKAC